MTIITQESQGGRNASQLVLALSALDTDMMATLSGYSHAAAGTDAARRAPAQARAGAVKQALALERLALERVCDDQGEAVARRSLLALVVAAGVRTDRDPAVLGAYDHIGRMIRTARDYRRVIDRHRGGHGGMAPGVPEAYERLRAQLAECGVGQI